jgi:hypothetical protein
VNSEDKVVVSSVVAALVFLLTLAVGGGFVSYRKDMACIERSGVTCDQAMKRCPEGKP